MKDIVEHMIEITDPDWEIVRRSIGDAGGATQKGFDAMLLTKEEIEYYYTTDQRSFSREEFAKILFAYHEALIDIEEWEYPIRVGLDWADAIDVEKRLNALLASESNH